MKYLLVNLTLVLCAAFSGQIFAQDTLATCVADTAFLNSGILISPTPYVNDTLGEGIVAQACINEGYEVRFIVSAPPSITLIGIPVTVDSIRIDSVSNLPEGLTYECTAENCIILADSISCIFLRGTPSANNTLGEYVLKIDLTVFTNILPLAISYPDPTLAPGSYILTLNEEGSANCGEITPVFDQSDEYAPILVYPNPTSDVLNFEYEGSTRGAAHIEIFSAGGQRIIEQILVDPQNGHSSLDVSKLGTGLYMLRLIDNEKVFNQKFFKY